MITPDYLAGIPDSFLALKFPDTDPPVIVAVEKLAIQYDPRESAPETETECRAVEISVAETLRPPLHDLMKRHDIVRSTGFDRPGSGVRWHHLDLTAALAAEEGIELRTRAHYIARHSSLSNR